MMIKISVFAGSSAIIIVTILVSPFFSSTQSPSAVENDDNYQRLANMKLSKLICCLVLGVDGWGGWNANKKE